MAHKVECNRCKAKILAETFDGTGGLCMRCKKKQLEEAECKPYALPAHPAVQKYGPLALYLITGLAVAFGLWRDGYAKYTFGALLMLFLCGKYLSARFKGVDAKLGFATYKHEDGNVLPRFAVDLMTLIVWLWSVALFLGLRVLG